MNFDLGVGYQFNNWLRFDVTGEYRGGSQFQSLYVLNDAGNTGTGNPTQLADFYRGNISSWVGLVNGYVDLGTWWGITPYVGAGVGLASNTLSGMTDQGRGHLHRHGQQDRAAAISATAPRPTSPGP